MGIIHPGVPHELVRHLRAGMPVANFVETGTFRGDSAIWAAGHFANVYTIEQSELFHRETSERYRDTPVTFLHDDSRAALRKLVPILRGPSLFWLDAHWSGVTGSAGTADQCPLLEELDILGGVPDECVILVDDARYFLCPPPPPHRVQDWPGLLDIFRVVEDRFTDHCVVVVDDVLVIAPSRLHPNITAYCREDSTTGRPPAVAPRETAGTGSGLQRGWRKLLRFAA